MTKAPSRGYSLERACRKDALALTRACKELLMQGIKGYHFLNLSALGMLRYFNLYVGYKFQLWC